MLEKLLTWCLSFWPTAVGAVDLSDTKIRPYYVKISCGFWCHLVLHTTCDNAKVQDLQLKGVRVFAFENTNREDPLWVAPEKLDHMIELCREHQSMHLLSGPWM